MEDRQKNLLKELSEILKKYNCAIALEDFGRGYHREDKIVIDFAYDESLGIVEQIVLGSYIDGTTY